MAANQEWYYTKGNQQFGPITAAELKVLALSGQISPGDLIWNEQWPDWRAAGTIKGFFPAEPQTKQTPPPIPTASGPKSQPTTANVADTVKSNLSDFVSSAKKVKDLAVAHTRRTQITKMSLPKAYLALGKDVFVTERFRDEFSDLYQQITAKNDEIAKAIASSKNGPQPSDLKSKIQSGAANLMAQGHAKQLGIQRDSLIKELGKRAFESHGAAAGSPELVSPLVSAVEEVGRLDMQITTPASNDGDATLRLRKPIPRLYWIVGGALMCLMGCCGLPLVFLSLLGLGVEHQEKEEEKQVQNEALMIVDASAIVSDYRQNTVAANDKYKGKVVQIVGSIKDIEERWIELDSVHGFDGKKFDLLRVYVYLTDKDKPKMSQLRQGQRITVKGKCTGKGFFDAINIERCVLVQ